MCRVAVGQVDILKFESSTNQAVCGIFPNKKLIEIYEGKIKDKIGEVWGERN